MKATSIIIAAITLFFVSCGSGTVAQNTTTQTAQPAAAKPAPTYDNSLPKGKIIDSVALAVAKDQSYTLYLPSAYTSARPFPCLFIFDAHARGILPVKLYKDLAEKYSFVFVSSNTSKNGMQWQQSNDVATAMMADAESKINIDPKQVYAAGFSGGARVASSIAIMDGGIAGVIGCAAGFPGSPNDYQNKFDYFGTAGNYDFNVTEMQQLDQALQQNAFTHQLLTFDGKHDWAPVADFQTALLWIQVNAIKESRQSKNDTIIAALKDDYDQRIKKAIVAKDYILAYSLLTGMTTTLDGLTDIASAKKQLADLATGSDYKNAIVAQAQLEQKEMYLQKNLKAQFMGQDRQAPLKGIAAINQEIKKAKTKQESDMYKRVLSYAGLLGYLTTNQAINSGDLTNAARYLDLFKIADPKNPDCNYLAAIYYLKKGNSVQSIASLNAAVTAGYNDAGQLLGDPAFASLRTDPGFNKVVSSIRSNMSK